MAEFNCEFIKVNPQFDKHVALIELNRPKELNALNRQLMEEIRDTLRVLDNDDEVRNYTYRWAESICRWCRYKANGQCRCYRHVEH